MTNPTEEQVKALDMIRRFGDNALIVVYEIIEALRNNTWENMDWINFYNEVANNILEYEETN